MAQIAPPLASGLEPRILAAGPARDRLYSYHGRVVCANLKARSDSSAGGASADSSPAAGSSPTELARRGLIDRDRDPGDRMKNCAIRSLAIEPISPTQLPKLVGTS